MMPFPREWYTQTPAASRAVSAITEGFCPFSHGTLTGDADCFPCDARWLVIRSAGKLLGFGAEYGWPSKKMMVSALTVYPFGDGWVTAYGDKALMQLLGDTE